LIGDVGQVVSSPTEITIKNSNNGR